MLSLARFGVVLFLLLVSFASAGEDNDTLKFYQEKIVEGKNTTFDFYGFRSGMTNDECLDLINFNKEYLEEIEYDPWAYGGRRSGMWGYSVSWSEEDFSKSDGVLTYLSKEYNFELYSITFYFTGDGLLWKLQADLQKYRSTRRVSMLYAIAKYTALKTVFPEAEISMGAAVISVVLMDPKLAFDTVLDMQAEFIKTFKETSPPK